MGFLPKVSHVVEDEDDDVDDDEDDGDPPHRVSHVGGQPLHLLTGGSRLHQKLDAPKLSPKMSTNISTKNIHQKQMGTNISPKYAPKTGWSQNIYVKKPHSNMCKKRATKSNLECVGLFPPNRAKNILNRVVSIVKIQHICKYTKYFDERVEGIFSSKGYSNPSFPFRKNV